MSFAILPSVEKMEGGPQMKVVLINSVKGGSTGGICTNICRLLTSAGIENYFLFGSGEPEGENEYCYSNPGYIKRQAIISRINGKYGFNSKASTRKIIKQLDKIQPDIVHLHNIHTHDCNMETLLGYLRGKQIKVMWTFHDCWAFTGGCAHYDGIECDGYRTGCNSCPISHSYSMFKSTGAANFRRKKLVLDGQKLTVVAPSRWMEQQVRSSFLGKYPVEVINNGIDLETFKPRESDFRTMYGLGDKKIYLAVASNWTRRKGIDFLKEITNRLESNEHMVIVGNMSQEDREALSDRVTVISRTEDAIELAEIYTAADVFVNTTLEDTFPTVNIEALACGTPVVTFATGGSPEVIDEITGLAVHRGDMDSMMDAIRHISMRSYANGMYSSATCRKRAVTCYNMSDQLGKYVELIDKVAN